MSTVKRNNLLGSVGLLLATILFVSCSSIDEPEVRQVAVVPTATEQVEVTESELESDSLLTDLIGEVREDKLTFTINITLTEYGFEPSSVFIPSGRNVQIVARNRGETEFHYKILGLVPKDVFWLSELEEEVVREADVTADEHDLHHSTEFVPWRAESLRGIQPSPDEVHLYTQRGEKDVIRFVPTNLGTFDVVDPLHPEFIGSVTVY